MREDSVFPWQAVESSLFTGFLDSQPLLESILLCLFPGTAPHAKHKMEQIHGSRGCVFTRMCVCTWACVWSPPHTVVIQKALQTHCPPCFWGSKISGTGVEQGSLGRFMEQRRRGEEGRRGSKGRIGRGSRGETTNREKWCEKDRDREKDGEREK